MLHSIANLLSFWLEFFLILLQLYHELTLLSRYNPCVLQFVKYKVRCLQMIHFYEFDKA